MKPPARRAVTRTVLTDPDTQEHAVRVRVDTRAQMTADDVQAVRDMLRAATPAGRLASLRTRAKAVAEEIPERALMLAALDRAEALLFKGADFWPVDAALIEASGLLERAERRREIRQRRAVSARAGQKGGEQSAAARSVAERDAELVRAYAAARKEHGRDAAGIIAKRFSISPAQVRKIVKAHGPK